MSVSYEKKEKYSIDDLLRIMEILRSEEGCPWDREQTHPSMRRDMIEEAYEVCEAIDLNDTDLLKEELGDVLLQVVHHARIEQEQGSFDFQDVCDGICRKLIQRHPHVFADVQVDGTEQVLKQLGADQAAVQRADHRRADTVERAKDFSCADARTEGAETRSQDWL